MNRFLLGTVSALAVVTSASAADIAARPYAKVPPVSAAAISAMVRMRASVIVYFLASSMTFTFTSCPPRLTVTATTSPGFFARNA